MELAQCRLVTDDVEGLAGFYARLLGVPTALNEYYVEIQAGQASVGFSRRRFTEHREADGPAAPGPAASGPGRRDDIILDFGVDDVDAEYPRIAALDVDWVMPPTTQPWGNRSMMFRDPAGNLVNVFCRGPVLWWIYDACGHDHDAGVGPGALTAVLIKAPGRVLRGFRVPWSLAPHFREEMTMHDHRKLGRELELFDTDPLIGAGLPYLLPAGAAIRHALEEYIGEVERRAGYQHVYSPVLGKRELYEISGHWAHYRDGMYPPTDIGGEQVVLRPSLCPHHAVIYRPGAHSYRDLPLRMAELGGMYRSELSGVLGGLTRVRAIQLNDAHVFRTPNQVAAEAAAALGLIEQAYRALGIEPTRYRLSLPGRDGKYVGGREMWDRATGLLEQVLVSAGVPYEAEEDEAAFYGPKIDVQIADSAEREASLSTVQVDFYLPERFGLEYVGADGARHRPMMVHATLGTPLLVGLFWGAPLVAAEAEAGTTQFAWMQSVTRKRWLAVKIGWMLLAAAVWGGVISALVTWWVSPTNAEQLNQFDPGRFDIMGIVPVGYSLFAVALGVTAGALLRRTAAGAGRHAGRVHRRACGDHALAAVALHQRGHRDLQRARRLHAEGRLLAARVGRHRPERPAAPPAEQHALRRRHPAGFPPRCLLEPGRPQRR